MLKLSCPTGRAKRCVDAKNNTLESEGKCSPSHGKANQACQSIWPVIDKGENKIKFESVSTGIPNISQVGVSASFANTIDDQKILNASV